MPCRSPLHQATATHVHRFTYLRLASSARQVCAARLPPPTALPPVQSSTVPATRCSPQHHGAGGRLVPEHAPAGRRAAERVTALKRGHARGAPLRRGALAEAARALAQRSAAPRRMLQQLQGMACSTAACLRGLGMATTCATSRRRRQATEPPMWTDGCDLPRCRLSRPQTIRPQAHGLCSCSPRRQRRSSRGRSRAGTPPCCS